MINNFINNRVLIDICLKFLFQTLIKKYRANGFSIFYKSLEEQFTYISNLVCWELRILSNTNKNSKFINNPRFVKIILKKYLLISKIKVMSMTKSLKSLRIDSGMMT